MMERWPPSLEGVRYFGQFVWFVIQRFDRDGCRQAAAALTYMSLFAVVPLLTVMYSMFALVPAFHGLGDELNDLIFENLVPASGMQVQQYISQFTEQARTLSALGALVLLVTSYLMLTNIEKTFNHIWGTTAGRSGLSSFLLYWGILSLGPLLLGGALVMRTYLLTLQVFLEGADATGLLAWVFSWVPLLLLVSAFTLLFYAVPNCKVSFRHSLIGGVVTTVFFEVAQDVFTLVIGNTSHRTIYGAFAILPVFLLWIYLCWVIILGGAELVRALETFRSQVRGMSYPRLTAVVMVLYECWRRQRLGRTVSDKDMLRLGLSEDDWRRLRDQLLEQRLLVETVQGRYVEVRDLGDLTLSDLRRLCSKPVTRLPNPETRQSLARYQWYPAFEARLDRLEEAVHEQLSLSVLSLFQEETGRSEGQPGEVFTGDVSESFGESRSPDSAGRLAEFVESTDKEENRR